MTITPSQTPGFQKVPTSFGSMPVFVPNTVLSGDGFHVSHNDYDVRSYGGETTALVRRQGQLFYILMGDHREAYAALIPQGFDACLAYFKSHPNLQHKFSDALPA